MSIVRTRPASDPLVALELFIRQIEDGGLGLVSVTEGKVEGKDCNVATFVFEPRTLPPVTLVKLDPQLSETQQQSILRQLDNEGRKTISFASVFDAGERANIAACRQTPVTSSVGVKVLRGKMSTFGGPRDPLVRPREGLALIEESEIGLYPSGLIRTPQEAGFPGLAKRLNPDMFYIACRWEQHRTHRRFLQKADIIVEANGKSAKARAVDFGPGIMTRVADLSPGLADFLDLKTDDEVVVRIPVQTTA